MSQGKSTRLLAVAIAVLLTGSLAGASSLVLCVGSDGHRAIEPEHAGTGCPTLSGPQGVADFLLQASAECLDVPAIGTVPVASASFDTEWLPKPPIAPLAFRLEPMTRVETRLPALTDAHAGASRLAPHLTSTVLLV